MKQLKNGSTPTGQNSQAMSFFPVARPVNAEADQEPVSDEFYYIVPDKCTECKGFHDEPQCAAVCPVDCCVPDDDHVETEEQLLAKKSFMHRE